MRVETKLRNAASTKEDASSSSSFAVGGYRGGGGGGRGAKETSSENEDEAKTTFAAERQREKTGLWIKRRKNTSPESRSDYRVHHCLSRAVAVAVAVDDGTEGVGKRNKESLRWNTSVRKSSGEVRPNGRCVSSGGDDKERKVWHRLESVDDPLFIRVTGAYYDPARSRNKPKTRSLIMHRSMFEPGVRVVKIDRSSKRVEPEVTVAEKRSTME